MREKVKVKYKDWYKGKKWKLKSDEMMVCKLNDGIT